jgi:signal transduction histidine kinase
MKKEITLNIPTKLDLTSAIDFCNRLWVAEEAEKYIFNFKYLGLIEPFSLAYVAAEIKRYASLKYSHGVKFQAVNYQQHSYAAHMGFFKAFGLQYGNEPGEASGSSRYIPLTILNVEALKQEAIDSSEYVGQIIEERSNELAKILTQEDNSDLVETLTFSFREIMRNVVEHSESEVLEFCAQYWPTKHKVEIVVLDSGIGIKESLLRNPFLTINDDREAIQLSLMPSISGKMYKGVKINKKNVWQNSGFGLYMTNRICRDGGSFFVCSNGAGLLLTKSNKQDVSTSFRGTAIRMIIDTRNVSDLNKRLEKYRDVGHRIAQSISESGSYIEASAASMMLSKDFEH